MIDQVFFFSRVGGYVQTKNVCTVMSDIFNNKTKNMHGECVKTLLTVIKNISLISCS